MKMAITAALATLIAGCGTVQNRPADLSPGPRPTDIQAEELVRDYLAHSLKDPDSLKQFRIVGVRQHEWQMTRWAPWFSGWLVCFEYNAKNSYGGYVGLKPGGIVLKFDNASTPGRFFNMYTVDPILGWC